MRAMLLVLSAAVAWAQLDSNSVTVAASRSIGVQADQVVFGVSVLAPVTASLDDVVAALQGSSITAAQLSGVAARVSNPMIEPRLQWSFNVPVPLATLTDTPKALAALERTLTQKDNGFSLSFAIRGTQASQQLLSSLKCSKSDLIADATAQARKMTNAAGLTLGPILAVSDVGTTGSLGLAYAAFSFVSGDFSGFPNYIIPVSQIDLSSLLVGSLPTQPVQPVTCSLTVKFGLLRY